MRILIDDLRFELALGSSVTFQFINSINPWTKLIILIKNINKAFSDISPSDASEGNINNNDLYSWFLTSFQHLRTLPLNPSYLIHFGINFVKK